MDLPSIKAEIGVSLGECPICYEAYETTLRSRAPKTLQCGHTLCLHCLIKLVCHSLLMTFVVCPFCRSVTMIPEEGVQGLKTDEETSHRSNVATMFSTTSDDALSQNSQFSSPRVSFSEGHTSSPRLSIFTVSDVLVPDQGQIWGGRYMHDIQSTYLLGISRRVALSQVHPFPASNSFSAHCLRLCLALGLIIGLGCIFFILFFFK